MQRLARSLIVGLAIVAIGGCGSTPRATDAPGEQPSAAVPTATGPAASAPPAATSVGKVPGVSSVLGGATTLADGRAFLFGGALDIFFSAGVDAGAIFDPATSTWTPTAEAPTGLMAPRMRVLPDGSVLVVGYHPDRQGRSMFGALVYDPAADAWREGGETETLKVGLGSSTNNGVAPLGTDGMVAVGPQGAAAWTATTGRWAELDAPFEGMDGVSAIGLPDGGVLALGVRGDGAPRAARAWVLDAAATGWTETPSPPAAFRLASGAALGDGSVIVVGGPETFNLAAGAMRFDPAAAAWRTAPSPHVARSGATLAALADGSVVLIGGSVVESGCATLESVERYDAASDSWTAIGSLGVPRAQHISTVLGDGRVLVAMGRTGSYRTSCTSTFVPPADAEVLDPTLLTAVSLAPNGAAPASATLAPPSPATVPGALDSYACSVPVTCFTPRGGTPLAGGGGVVWAPPTHEVLVVGADGKARPIKAPKDTLNLVDVGTRLGDGSVLLVSRGTGLTGATKLTYRLEVATGALSPAAETGLYSSITGLVTLSDGRALLIGQPRANEGAPVDDAQSTTIYDATADTWTPIGAAPASRNGGALVALADGRALLIGGDSPHALADAWAFDPASGTWSAAAPMPAPRTGATALALADGRVLVLGGWDANGPRPDAVLYDPSADAWTPAGALPAPRSRFALVQAPDAHVLLAGGWPLDGSGTPLASTLVFDPATATWQAGPDLSRGRGGAVAFALADGRIAVVGGEAPLDTPAKAILTMDLFGS